MEELENLSDEKLVIHAQNGYKKAEDFLLHKYKNLVKSIVRRFIFLENDVDDFVQEGMIGLANAIDSFDEKTSKGKSFKNYAYLCAYSKIVDFMRKYNDGSNKGWQGYVPIYTDGFDVPIESPEEGVINREGERELEEFLSENLSDKEFKIFFNYLKGYSNKEICDMTGYTYKTVDNAVARSKKKIKNKLEGK